MQDEIQVEGLPTYAQEAMLVLQHLIALRIRIVGRSSQEVYQKFVSEFPPPMKPQVDTIQKAIEKIDTELWNAARAVAEASGQRVSMAVAFEFCNRVVEMADGVQQGKISEDTAFQAVRGGLLDGEQ